MPFLGLSKNVSCFSTNLLSIFFYSYFDQIQKNKSLAFFDRKHGLTPLEKCHFWDFEKFCFYTQKKFLFYLEHYLTLFLVLFWPKPNKEKIGIFWPKAWVKPFGKMRFLGLSKIFLYIVQRTFLVSLQSY